MSFKRLTIDGFGQVELNNVAFRRDGRIEAQCAPDSSFASNGVENGMLVAVDDLTRKITIPTDASLPIGLVYSAEHIYDERTPGLKNFKLKGTEDFLPRVGYFAKGDKFTENCVGYESTEFSDDATFISALAAIATTGLYGGISETGAIAVSSSAPSVGPKLRVVKKTTMPDGQLGIKFQVITD